MKRVLFVILAIVVTVAAYPAWLGFQVWDQSHQDELRSVDAIVVLGAAQYDGEPSLVFRARLDHAAFLYGEGFSGTVIVTGGKRAGDRFTEAEAGESYLVGRGIPQEDIMQVGGQTTLTSLERVRRTIQTEARSLLLVSDPLHSERIKRIVHDLGFADVYTSPASYVELNRTRRTKARELVREVASILVYELFGR
ncbi:MAG: YdcF family protein [Actinomycetota bacterium]